MSSAGIRKVFAFGDEEYQIDVIDTWNMTVQDKGVHTGTVMIDLPQREYMAIRWRKINN